MLDPSIKSKTEFLAALERLTIDAAALPNDEMVKAFESVPENNFTLAEWYKLVEFALNQISQWQVKWLFSSAQAPDTRAQIENDAWKRMWDVFSKALIDRKPEIEEQLRKIKDLSIAQKILERKLQLDSGNQAAVFATSTMGSLSLTLNRLGFRGIARGLYKLALFPSGSVGRAQDSSARAQ